MNRQSDFVKEIVHAHSPCDLGTVSSFSILFIKPGLHETQLPVERSVTLVSFIVVEERCALERVAASLDYNKRN